MKRRDFIKKGGLLSAGIMASTYSISSMGHIIGANNQINVGVIGTGSRGSGLIPILNGIEGVEVTACCDILPFRLEEGLKRSGSKAKAYTDYRALLEDKDIDAVIVTTPFNTHSAIAIDAIEAGKHVYSEKTMAKGFKGINALVEKVSKSNIIFQTGHQYHSSRLYNHAVKLIEQGEIGEVISFECQWNRQGDWRRPVPDPSLERAINWRMYREYSGGMAAELSSHQIDFVNWVLKENPKQIMGVGGIDYWKDGRETFDNIHLLFEYPSGVKAKFTCLTTNAFGDYQIKVLGSKGAIQLDYDKAWISYEKGFEKELGDVDGVSGATMNHNNLQGAAINISHIDPTKQALVDFKDSIINHTTPISNVYTGAHTAVAVQMSLDAMINNEIVYWDDKHNFK